MNTLTLDVSKNTLKISATGSMTSGNEGYLQVSLILDADWAGAAIYPAYMVGGTEYSDYPATAISGTTFIIPTAIGQSDGIIRLGLIGVVDSVIMRTNYVFIPLLIGAATGTAVPLPTPAALEALQATPAALEALQATIAAKQDTLTAGTNITITDNVISASGGAVNSVNGETGDVVLDAADVGADADGTAASAVAAHNFSAAAHSTLFAGKAKYVDLGTDVTTDGFLASNIFDTATDAATIYRGACLLNNNGDTAWVFNTPSEEDATVLRQVMLSGGTVYSRENWGTSWSAWRDVVAPCELVARKVSSITAGNSTSTNLYPSVKATVDYVATAITGAIGGSY